MADTSSGRDAYRCPSPLCGKIRFVEPGEPAPSCDGLTERPRIGQPVFEKWHLARTMEPYPVRHQPRPYTDEDAA